MFERFVFLISALLFTVTVFSEENSFIETHYIPSTDLVKTRFIKMNDRIVIREFYKYNERNLLVGKIIDNGTSRDFDQMDQVTERLVIDFILREEEPFYQMPEWVDISYSDGNDLLLIQKDKLIYDLDGSVRSQVFYQNKSSLSFQFIRAAQSGNIHLKRCMYDMVQQRWVDPISGLPLDHTNLYHEPQIAGGCGRYLLGLGEIVLGGALMLTGAAVEIGSFGTLTVGVAIVEGSGAALIGHGLSLTTSHAQETGSYILSKNDPGTPKDHGTQQQQAKDAKKEIEKLLGRKLTKDEERKFHDHVSGQNLGYHDMVTEGWYLLGGS